MNLSVIMANSPWQNSLSFYGLRFFAGERSPSWIALLRFGLKRLLWLDRERGSPGIIQVGVDDGRRLEPHPFSRNGEARRFARGSDLHHRRHACGIHEAAVLVHTIEGQRDLLPARS